MGKDYKVLALQEASEMDVYDAKFTDIVKSVKNIINSIEIAPANGITSKRVKAYANQKSATLRRAIRRFNEILTGKPKSDDKVSE